MSPRYRSRYRHLKLPDHVGVQKKINAKGQKVLYFHYVLPDGNREQLGKDLDEAKAVATALNLRLYSSEKNVERLLKGIDKKTAASPSLEDVVDEFTEQWLSKQNYSVRSYKERLIRLRQYCNEWPDRPIEELVTYDLAQFLKPLSNESKRQHRFLLVQLFNFAKSEGYYNLENPAASILRVKAEKRKRYRHTWEGFNTVKTAAPEWLANAMDSAFYSLQRRSDLVALKRPDHIDLDAGTITILQAKTGAYLEINMGQELLDVVKKSYASGIPCPYLVHCRPKQIRPKDRKKKPHPFAVLPNYLTTAYSKARDESGAYGQIEDKKLRPSFHDIRALGIWTYFKAGYPIEYIQALAGHAEEAMTLRYEEGHEKAKPLKVEAGLSLAAVDFSDIDWQTGLPKSLAELVDGEEDQ